MEKPAFIITIDTEGDNLWSAPKEIKTNNARFLPRFQRLAENYGFKPVYLTDYEMASDAFFVEFGREVLRKEKGEIGMHLHAWNSPPVVPLTTDDYKFMPFLTEFPENVITKKVEFMTQFLEKVFDTRIISHRGGRWSFNSVYARVIHNFGYKVDCSVTPYVSWQNTLGKPTGAGGSDFSKFPDYAYFLDLENISRKGKSDLLEVPMTILPGQAESKLNYLKNIPVLSRLFINYQFKKFMAPKWLRPSGNNLEDMLQIVEDAAKNKKEYIMFMLHSSEFMPGGSPTFKTENDIEKLYNDMSVLFQSISEKGFEGKTLKEFFYQKVSQRK